MQRVGTAILPLHGGKAPRWLFDAQLVLNMVASGSSGARTASTEFARNEPRVEWLEDAVAKARIGRIERLHALRRLTGFEEPSTQ